MLKMGLAPIYQHPKTSEPHPQHKVYPYLLRQLTIDQPNQVWCADVTYIPMRRGFLYLVAIIDWASRKVLAWRLSNTMDADFCVAALEEAIARYGRPDIFNTDQGSAVHQLRLHQHAAGRRHTHLDGRPWPLDGERLHRRLWRSLKYECVFLNAFETGSEARTGIGSLDRLLQRRASALGLRRQDARRGLCYEIKRGELGGVIQPRIYLSQAAILSRKPGPPHLGT